MPIPPRDLRRFRTSARAYAFSSGFPEDSEQWLSHYYSKLHALLEEHLLSQEDPEPPFLTEEGPM